MTSPEENRKLEGSVAESRETDRPPSMFRIAIVVFIGLVMLAVLEYVYYEGGTRTAAAFWFWAGVGVAGSLVGLFFRRAWTAVLKALPSVNLAVVLIAFVGLECTLGTLSLQRADIERLPPEEQVRQFRYAQGSFLYRLLGGKVAMPDALDSKSEAYYKLLSEKFGTDYGARQRRDALMALKRQAEEKAIEEFIARHEGLLDGIFAFMRVSGLFHTHTAWWFRFTLFLLGVNLAACTVDRYRGRLRQTGFLLTHGGVLIIFIGAGIGVWQEQKGMIGLRVGQMDRASAFLDQRSGREQPFGFTVQLADFKTTYHRELFVEFLDVPAASLPPNAVVRRAYKIGRNKAIELDQGRVRIRVLDFMPEAVLESRMVNLSPEPKNPAIEVKVQIGEESRHKWLFAEEDSVFNDSQNMLRVKYVRPTSDADLQDVLRRAKESSLGHLTLEMDKTDKKQAFALAVGAKFSFGPYTVEVVEVQPNFQLREGAPPLGPAVLLHIRKDNEEERRLVFERFDFGQFHAPKFADLKTSLRIPAWEAPSRFKCLLVQKGDAFSVYLIEGKVVTGPLLLKVKEPWAVGKSGATLTILQYFPDAGLERNVVPVTSKPQQQSGPPAMLELVQPAAKLHIQGPGFETTQWLLANSSEAGVFEQKGYLRITYADNTEKMPVEWVSHLLFLDEGRPVMSGMAKVNHPVKFRDYSFYQSDANKDDPTYSGIQVVRDPSWAIVNIGLLTVIAGVLFTFYVKPYLA